jgi:sulfur carrier protein
VRSSRSGGFGAAGSLAAMKVLLRNPRRELEVPGPMTVAKLLARLELNPESVLVIQGDTLVPKDARLADSDSIEIRPVISGGAT